MTVNVGLIGCGGIAGAHLGGYANVEDARITAVCDVVEDNALRRAEQAGGAEIFSDIETLLARAEVDAVDVCLPHHLHKDAIVAAAAAGKHILCEKPLCLNLDEAAEVKKAVADAGITLMCAHNQLFFPAIQQARKLLDGGVIGQVYEIRTVDSFVNDFDPANMGWRAHRELIGGGELIDTGYHPSYLLFYLAGSRPTEVTAMTSKHRLHFMDGEDSAQVLVRFENGAVGNIVTSWAYEPPDLTEKFTVVGEKGWIYGSPSELRYKIRGTDPVAIHVIKTSEVNTIHAEIADFVACVRDKRPPIHNEDDGIDVLKMILGAFQSVDEKRTVSLTG